MNNIKFAKCFLSFCVLLAVGGCNVRKNTSLFNSPYDIVTDTITKIYVVNEQSANDVYRIKVGDRLILRNLQSKEFLSTSSLQQGSNSANAEANALQVDSLGFITVPSFAKELAQDFGGKGKVKVSGLSRSQVNAVLQSAFEKILANPIIDVSVVNVKVTLLGEFARQGNFLLNRDNTTLIDIIGEAGGITAAADPKTCKIIRGNRANPEIIYVNLNNINSLAAGNKLVLQNNDIITIMQTKSFAATNKLQNINNFVQPVLVLLNLGLLILTITK